jgi:hypothetical protein
VVRGERRHGCAVDDGGRDEGLPFTHAGGGDGGGVDGEGNFGGAKTAGGLGERGGWAAVWPSAAEGEIDAEAECAALRLTCPRKSLPLVAGILKQSEAGVKTPDLCREHGISAASQCTFA